MGGGKAFGQRVRSFLVALFRDDKFLGQAVSYRENNNVVAVEGLFRTASITEEAIFIKQGKWYERPTLR